MKNISWPVAVVLVVAIVGIGALTFFKGAPVAVAAVGVVGVMINSFLGPVYDSRRSIPAPAPEETTKP